MSKQSKSTWFNRRPADGKEKDGVGTINKGTVRKNGKRGTAAGESGTEYIVALLERIAFYSHPGNMEFDEHCQMIKDSIETDKN